MYIPPNPARSIQVAQRHEQERAILRTFYALAFIYSFKMYLYCCYALDFRSNKRGKGGRKGTVQMQLCDSHSHV